MDMNKSHQTSQLSDCYAVVVILEPEVHLSHWPDLITSCFGTPEVYYGTALTMTAKTYRHVNKTQSSVQGKVLPPSNASHKSAEDNIPVGKGITVAHVGSASASRLAAVLHTSSLSSPQARISIHNLLVHHIYSVHSDTRACTCCTTEA